MTNKQMCVIVGAIIIGVLLIIFLPPYLNEKAEKEAQMERDESLECLTYRLTAYNNRIDETYGRRPDYAKEERRRKAAGCTPE